MSTKGHNIDGLRGWLNVDIANHKDDYSFRPKYRSPRFDLALTLLSLLTVPEKI